MLGRLLGARGCRKHHRHKQMATVTTNLGRWHQQAYRSGGSFAESAPSLGRRMRRRARNGASVSRDVPASKKRALSGEAVVSSKDRHRDRLGRGWSCVSGPRRGRRPKRRCRRAPRVLSKTLGRLTHEAGEPHAPHARSSTKVVRVPRELRGRPARTAAAAPAATRRRRRNWRPVAVAHVVADARAQACASSARTRLHDHAR